MQPRLHERVVGDQDALDLTVPTLSAPATSLSAPLETHATRSLMVCALLLVDMVADSLQAHVAAAPFPRSHAA